jgi:riboflavin biosynthesis pyrimidine reductase
VTLALELLGDHADVTRAVRTVYGRDISGATGIIHATAVWRSPEGSLATLNINADTPPSRLDRFVLNLARARADAIITTGKVLREEPSVTPLLIGSLDEVAPLVDWRREVLGKEGHPLALVLTSGRSLDLDHPFFRSPIQAIVFTSHDAASDIMPAAQERSIEVVSHPTPSIIAAATFLQKEMDSSTVAIEAGSSTSLQLYRPSLVVDELLLSEFLGPALPPSVKGAPFLGPASIEEAFPGRSEPYEVVEPSGPWRFRRWTARTDK